MKKLISISMLLLAFSLVFISCSREDDNDSSVNYMQIDNGEKIAIDNAGFTTATSGSQTFVLFSFINLSKSANCNLALYFPSSSTVDGDFSVTSTTRTLDDFQSGFSMLSNGSVVTYDDLKSGTCTVKKDGDKKYTVTFSFTASNGKIVSGKYSGNVFVQ